MGRRLKPLRLFDATIRKAQTHGQGLAVKVTQSTSATLYNGVGRYDQALAAAQEANRTPHHWASHVSLHELVEAAVRSGRPTEATEALEELSQTTQASGSDWAIGIEARSRALLSAGDAADALYREAIERLDRTPIRPEAARARLLYGEWLRRERRRADARDQLRTAHHMLDAMGMEAFAERARRELRATGESARQRSVETTRDLTPREAQIATLACDGLSNAEIGTRLFISAHTVDYHLRKVFTKLGISSRLELREGLGRRGVLTSSS